MMALVSVIVPVYYNAESIPLLMERLTCVADAALGDVYEFVFVDDGSGDDSFEVLEGFARRDPRVRVISYRAILAPIQPSRQG